MKKRNYFIAIILAILLAFTAFGCGGDDPGTGGGGNGGGSGSVTVYVTQAGYGIEWLEQFKTGFKAETGIDVNVEEKGGLAETIREKYSKIAEGKSVTDLADIYYCDFGNWSEYIEALEPLDNLNIVKNNQINADVKKWGTEKGKFYIFHQNMAMETFVYNQAYLNEIESYGEYSKGQWPTTWQGLLDLCEQLVENMGGKIDGKSVIPFALYKNGLFDAQKLYETLFAQGNGGQDYQNFFNLEIDAETASDDKKSIFASDSMAEAMFALKNLLKVDQKSNSEFKYFKAYTEDMTAIESFLAGESLFCWHGSFFATEAKDEIANLNDIGDNYNIGVVPALDGCDRTVVLNWPQEYISIPKAAKNKENAIKFLNYIYKKENVVKIIDKMNAIPAINYTYSDSEISSLGRWTKDVIKTFNTFNAKDNGINFPCAENPTKFFRANSLRSLNFDKTSGNPIYFSTMLIDDPDFNRDLAGYKKLLSDTFEQGIKQAWSLSWVDYAPIV